MGGYFRMQDLTDQSTNTVQDKEDAIDVGAYRYLVIQIRVAAAATGGSIQFEEAMVNENSAFQDVGSTVSLTAVNNLKLILIDPMRFLRWKTISMNGTARFTIEVIGRN